MEVLKQPQFAPYPLEEQVAILFIAVNGGLMDVEVSKVSPFIGDFLKYLKSRHTSLLENIAKTGILSAELETELANAVEAFKQIKENRP
jgi:F-type H+-transporting ATPase subunit alpha